MKTKILLLFGLALFLQFGCQTPEYYQEQAVIKAREFLVKKAHDLTIEEIAYVKYNVPTILHSRVIGSVENVDSSTISSDLSQISISWKIPTRDELFLVWGVSSSSLRDFAPERLIRRKINPRDLDKELAIRTARTHILNNLFHDISIEDYNYLRFANPVIVKSKFPHEKAKNEPEIMKIFSSKEQINVTPYQFTIYWNCRKSNDKIMVAGFATEPNLKDFKPFATGQLEDKIFNENIILGEEKK